MNAQLQQQPPYVYNPLERQTFEAIAHNAVGRASEINTYASLRLTHSTGNSGWSVGAMQWDFGQPGRGAAAVTMLDQYQASAAPAERFSNAEVQSLVTRLQTRGQVGNALAEGEKARLESWLRSDPGRDFVEGLGAAQVQRKWQNVGEPLSQIPWLQRMATEDPASAAEIVAMTSKLYNQNEIRGGRLIEHLQSTEISADQTRDWIGAAGIEGLNVNARSAIVSGRDSVLAGIALVNRLEQGEGRLSEAWNQQVHQNGNVSLNQGFNNNPDLQLLDGMLRSPVAGSRIFGYVEQGAVTQETTIRGIDASARLEMARTHLDRNGTLTVESPSGEVYEMTRDGWNRDGVPMQGAADQTMGVSSPSNPAHPDHAMLLDIRSGVAAIDARLGRTFDESSERVSHALLVASRQDQPGLERVDGVYLGQNGNMFAVQGQPDDPASRRVCIDTQQAIQTPVAQSEALLQQANEVRSHDHERQLAADRDIESQRSARTMSA